MSIRIITKKTGRVYARMHSILFHMGKGNCDDGNPYGIIPTGQKDPLGIITSTKSPLKVSIKPGQFCCYGRQCIINEETTIVDDIATEWTQSDKCYVTIYAEINLNDVVDQRCTIKADMREQAYIDFKNDMERQNLYKRANGIYDVPIARFIYEPNPSRSDYFFGYEQLIGYFDPQSRAEAKELNTNMFGKPIGKLISDGYFTLPAVKAEHATGTDAFGKKNPVAIMNDLHGMYSCKRVKILTFASFSDFQAGTERIINVNIDKDHLVGASFWIGKTDGFSATFPVSGFRKGATFDYKTFINVPATIDQNRRGMFGEGMHRLFLNGRCSFKKDKPEEAKMSLYMLDMESLPSLLCINLYTSGDTGKAMLKIRGCIDKTKPFYVIGAPTPYYIDTPIITNPNGTAIYADFLYKGDVDVF